MHAGPGWVANDGAGGVDSLWVARKRDGQRSPAYPSNGETKPADPEHLAAPAAGRSRVAAPRRVHHE
jgi:hypothetical protein